MARNYIPINIYKKRKKKRIPCYVSYVVNCYVNLESVKILVVCSVVRDLHFNSVLN